MEDVSLDDMIKQKKMENRRNKGRRNRDNDGDVEMGSSRGPGYSTRGPRQRNRNRSTPYKKNKYTTSGDSSKAWKHDFYGKEDEEIEETGWRKKEKKEDDLLDGTSVIIDRRNDRGGDRRNGRGDDRRNDTGTRITFVNRTSR